MPPPGRPPAPGTRLRRPPTRTGRQEGASPGFLWGCQPEPALGAPSDSLGLLCGAAGGYRLGLKSCCKIARGLARCVLCALVCPVPVTACCSLDAFHLALLPACRHALAPQATKDKTGQTWDDVQQAAWESWMNVSAQLFFS